MERRGKNPVHPEHLHGDQGAHDIHNGIDRADLMEADLFNRFLMNLRFDGGQPGEQSFRPFPDTGAHVRAVDNLLDIGQAPVVMRLTGLNDKTGSLDLISALFSDDDVIS